jgi:hypothetical protein
VIDKPGQTGALGSHFLAWATDRFTEEAQEAHVIWQAVYCLRKFRSSPPPFAFTDDNDCMPEDCCSFDAKTPPQQPVTNPFTNWPIAGHPVQAQGTKARHLSASSRTATFLEGGAWEE